MSRSIQLLTLGYALGVATAVAASRLIPPARGPAAASASSIGGFFFKVSDPDAYREWYATHLGISFNEGEGHHNICWRDAQTGAMVRAVWGPFPDGTTYFEPGRRDYMHNFRVADLDGLLARLETDGVEIVDVVEEYDYGRFAWILDLEGNRVELWEPSEETYDTACGP